ncbi:MAG: DUF3999 family protein [Deltaproteobacteria bacterium]|nr:DUF3999 family protein [Candidatus Zymogenaceae bacterium]
MTVRRAGLSILIAALFLSGAGPSLDSSVYRYLAHIEVTAPGYVFFNILPDVYDKAKPNLSDLRISTVDAIEVPYVIWSNSRTSERKKIETQVLNTSYIPQSYTTFTLDVGDTGIRTNSITITTGSTDFVRRITVEGSPDNRKFAVLKENDYVFDLTSDHNIKNLSISYPMTDYRYLKVTLWDDGEEPLVEVGGNIYLVEDIKGESEVIPSAMKVREVKTPKPITEITVDLAYKNIPTSTIALLVSDTNFKRDVTLLSANVDTPKDYKETLTTSIYSIKTSRFSRSNTTIDYPRTQARYLKLIIEDENNTPLTISGVTVSGVPQKITFSANPGKEYVLYLGNPRIESPLYDIVQVFSYIDRNSFLPVSLGPIIENPDYKPGSDLPMTERYPFILWGAIALMILILGGIIIRMMIRLAGESKQ